MSNGRFWRAAAWSCAVAFSMQPMHASGGALKSPDERVAFAGIKSGDKVADFMPGSDNFTRILCSVVGAEGHVYAISVLSETPGQSCANVTMSTLQNRKRAARETWSASDDPGEVYEYWSFTPAAELFSAPEPLDAIWIAENYHQLHSERLDSPNMFAVGTAMLNSLKPGGILIVEDDQIALLRARKEMVDAGFVFVAQSKVLNDSNDSHIVKAHGMQDRTDRFLVKFRRP